MPAALLASALNGCSASSPARVLPHTKIVIGSPHQYSYEDGPRRAERQQMLRQGSMDFAWKPSFSPDDFQKTSGCASTPCTAYTPLPVENLAGYLLHAPLGLSAPRGPSPPAIHSPAYISTTTGAYSSSSSSPRLCTSKSRPRRRDSTARSFRTCIARQKQPAALRPHSVTPRSPLALAWHPQPPTLRAAYPRTSA